MTVLDDLLPLRPSSNPVSLQDLERLLSTESSDQKLHVILVISNPCQFQRRYQLAKECIQRFEHSPAPILVYVVELAYNITEYEITDPDHPRHLRLTAETPMWHKENLVNIAVRTLLPDDWLAMAWIDADLEFESWSWARDTLHLLSTTYDIVQLFSHCIDMDPQENAMSIFSGFGYQHQRSRGVRGNGHINQWHPGYAWAMHRKAYDQLGGFYDVSILGSGDMYMAMAWIGCPERALNKDMNVLYIESLKEYSDRARGLRLGYVPGVIRHHFHGTKKNRGYDWRWKILQKYAYHPGHLIRRPDGLLEPGPSFPAGLASEIVRYFQSRKEDSSS